MANAALWAVGATVVIGGGIGAYILLRPKEAQAAGGVMSDGGGGAGYGSTPGSAPAQGYDGASENAAYGGQGGAVQSQSIGAGIVNAQPQGNAGAAPIGRDLAASGGRTLASSPTSRPESGLMGMDTTGIAASRNRPVATPPAPSGPALVKTATVKPAFRDLNQGQISAVPISGGKSFGSGTYGSAIFGGAPSRVSPVTPVASQPMTSVPTANRPTTNYVKSGQNVTPGGVRLG